MINGFITEQAAKHPPHLMQARCEVCDAAISSFDALTIKDFGYSVCRSFSCRRIMSQKSLMAPLLFASHLSFNKKLILRQRERDLNRKKHIEAVIEKESKENQEIYDTILSNNSGLQVESTHLVEIPSGSDSLIPISDTRRNQYTEHLTNIINEAQTYNNASEVIYDEHHDAHGKMLIVEQRLTDKPQLREVSDSLCALCKGGCCASGKEHAYLSVFSMRSYMDTHPQLSVEEILEQYVAKINPEGIENSCINHTKTGCALPRELRSDICNGYYCESLKSYQINAAARERLGALVVVQRSSSYWIRFEPGVVNEVVDAVLLGEKESSDPELPRN